MLSDFYKFVKTRVVLSNFYKFSVIMGYCLFLCRATGSRVTWTLYFLVIYISICIFLYVFVFFCIFCIWFPGP